MFLATYGIVGQTVTNVTEEDNTTQIIAIVVVAVLALLCVALLTAVICLKRKFATKYFYASNLDCNFFNVTCFL